MIASFQISYLTHASQDDDAGRHFIAPLFNAPAFDCSTSNSVRQSAESGTNFGIKAATLILHRVIRMFHRICRGNGIHH